MLLWLLACAADELAVPPPPDWAASGLAQLWTLEHDALSERGRSLSDLTPHAGRLYVGYGDYAQELGPLDVLAWSPAEGPTVEAAVATDELHAFLEVEGRLLAPAYDHVGGGVEGGVFVREPDGTWSATAPTPGGIHVFDVAWHEGRLWAAADSAVVSSADDGASWVVEHTGPEVTGSEHFRCYFLEAAGDALLAVGRIEFSGPARPRAFVRRDGVWTELAGLSEAKQLAPLVLDERIWLVDFTGLPGKGARHLGVYEVVGDGVEPREPVPDTQWIGAIDVADGVARLATWEPETGLWRIVRSTDLEVWTESEPFELPERITSLGVLGETVFAGTQQGSIWRLPP